MTAADGNNNMELTKLSRRGLLTVALLFATLFLAACGGINKDDYPLGPLEPKSDASGAELRVGDELDAIFSSPPPPYNATMVDTIKEDGSITFIHGALNECFLPESTELTLNDLAKANGSKLYQRHVIPGYGHIDCIYGKNAVKDVYPFVLEHLEATL